MDFAVIYVIPCKRLTSCSLFSTRLCKKLSS